MSPQSAHGGGVHGGVAMGREVNRLSARKIQTLTEAGRYADGDGLHLVVDAAGAKRWVMLYRMAGRRREMGLGPLGRVGLAAAREKAKVRNRPGA